MVKHKSDFWDGFRRGMGQLFRPFDTPELPDLPPVRTPKETVEQAWSSVGKHLHGAMEEAETELSNR